jgi:DNA-binding HxlR family transcriptional regulator
VAVGVEATWPVPEPDGDAFHNHCPGRMVLDHVRGRWGMLILLALQPGPLRFFELRDTVGGISEKMLSQNLRVLLRDGLIERTVEPVTPPRVSYALAPLGEELAVPLRALLDWIALRTKDVVAAQRRHDAAADQG